MSGVVIPADIDREDRIVFGLTARQLAIMGIGALIGWVIFLSLSPHLPAVLSGAAASIVLTPAAVLSFSKPSGVHPERLLAARVRRRIRPGKRVFAPEGVSLRTGRRGVGPLDFPVVDIRENCLVLDDQSRVAVCRASPINYHLRSDTERRRLIEGFKRMLNASQGSFQFAIRSNDADLGAEVRRIRGISASLPDTELIAQANRHADYIEELARTKEAFSREILLSFREAHDIAGADLERRVESASSLLRAVGIRLDRLEDVALFDLLRRSWSERSPNQSEGLRSPSSIVTNDRIEIADEHLPLVGPSFIEESSRRLRVGDSFCETFAVIGYPREVSPGWLSDLLSFTGTIDVSIHVEPIPNDAASAKLRTQLARLESTRRIEAGREQLPDATIEAAASDASALLGQVARGESRLFRAGLYVTVRASDDAQLDGLVHRAKALCSSLLLDTVPTTERAPEGWISTLPLCRDEIILRRTLDTDAVSSFFPFASSEMHCATGVFVGQNSITGGMVFHDRFALENHNQVVLARSGAGKSYFAKTQILRHLWQGVEVLVIDPEDEYVRLAESVGGTLVRAGEGSFLNPLELAGAGEAGAVTEQALFVHTLVESLVGAVGANEKGELDRAILAAYSNAGVTEDPKTHKNPPPLLSDVARHLEKGGSALAERLGPHTVGTHSAIFAPSDHRIPRSHLVVFSLRELPEAMKAPAMLLALNAIWRRVKSGERRPRLVVVDEAWWLLSEGKVGSAFLHRLAKSARKNWCGLTTITQDVEDVLSTPLGKAVVTNASTQVLLGQSPQSMEALTKAFGLTDGEGALLTSCRQGEALLIVGEQRAAVRILASEFEHHLATTSPGDPIGDSAGITSETQSAGGRH